VIGTAMAGLRHFLDLDQIEGPVLRGILDHAAVMKRERASGADRLLAGRTLAMIFEKPSTRTRVSFEIAIRQMGGHALVLNSRDLQLGRGETVADTARVLSRFVDAIMIRTDGHQKLLELAEHATVPVINGLTDLSHPCQVMADVMTFEELRGPIRGRTVAWCGDANNVATSFVHAAVRFDFALNIACPEELSPAERLLDWAASHQGRIRVMRDPREAVGGADCVVTDTWVSMSDRDAERRRALLEPYRVDAALMGLARPDALFLHCLPAHRGEEVTSEVLDGPNSAVLDEAENRLHAQKGILAWCMAAAGASR
jgi:ornithine carbamoyltransferase